MFATAWLVKKLSLLLHRPIFKNNRVCLILFLFIIAHLKKQPRALKVDFSFVYYRISLNNCVCCNFVTCAEYTFGLSGDNVSSIRILQL